MTISCNEGFLDSIKDKWNNFWKHRKEKVIKNHIDDLNQVKEVSVNAGDLKNYNDLRKYTDKIKLVVDPEDPYVISYDVKKEKDGTYLLDKLYGRLSKINNDPSKKDIANKEIISLSTSDSKDTKDGVKVDVRTITISHKSADGYNDHDNVLTLKYISDYKDKAEERLELLDKRMAKLEKLILKK